MPMRATGETVKQFVIAAVASLALFAGCDQAEPPAKTVPTTNPGPQVSDPNAASDDLDTNVHYSHGPMKLMMPEQVLMSIARLTEHDFGSHDITNPATPDPSEFLVYCQAMGGCPDHVTRQRNTGVGLVYVLTLDKAANTACIQDDLATGMIPPGTDGANQSPTAGEVETAIKWQYKKFIGSEPVATELEGSRLYFESHLAMSDPDTGDPTGENGTHDFESALRGHCMALVTSAKFLYH
jgi:hypothetical protein